jgi:hypothetical protein
MTRLTVVTACVAATLFSFPFAPNAAAGNCENLRGLTAADATVVSAETIGAGAFSTPLDAPLVSSERGDLFSDLPAFCRVRGTLRPSNDSRIEFEVWLPIASWNGRYVAAGNGGFGGSINFGRLAEAVRAGYAGSSTDTGHTGIATDQSWALGHPEKIVDFSYRAVHETAEASKAVIRVFYGEYPKWSYFNSCSNGGRQGLMEAQRYPADYDGIVAGAPWMPGKLGSGSDDTAELDLNASDTNLAAFSDRGGKLILYHGEKDDPESTIQYYQSVVNSMGERTVGKFIRLYVVPGMGHCGGGRVAGDFGQRIGSSADAKSSVSIAVELWVEKGIAPDRIIAAKHKVDGDIGSDLVRTRPLCPYPQKARYVGKGRVNDAANYSCD